MPVIADIQGTTAEATPVISSSPWSDDSSIPALSFYFGENDAPASENLRVSSPNVNELIDSRCPEVTADLPEDITDKDKSPNTNVESITTQNQSSLTIPTVTVSEPVEKTRKISVVIAPDIDKLLLPANTEGQARVKKGKKPEISSSVRRPKATQFSLYNSRRWATVKNLLQPQIQFTNSKKGKGAQNVSMCSRKTSDNKVTLFVSRCKGRQVTVLCDNHFERVPCFIDLDVENSHETRKICSKTSKASSTQDPRGLGTRKAACWRRSETFQRQERVFKTLPAHHTGEGQSSSEECSGEESDDSKTKYGARLDSATSIEVSAEIHHSCMAFLKFETWSFSL